MYALVFFAMLLERFPLDCLARCEECWWDEIDIFGIPSHVFVIVFHVSLTDGSLRLCAVPSQSISERDKCTVPLSTCLPSPLSNMACAFAKASPSGTCRIPFVTPVGDTAVIGVMVGLSCVVPLFAIVNRGCECCTRSWGPGYIVGFGRVKVPSVRSILNSTTW
jgi:hypothetical protein